MVVRSLTPHPDGVLFTAENWQQSLPYLTVLWALVWSILYKLVGDRVILLLLPAAARKRVEQKKAENRLFDQQCRVNGTAFLNAVLTTPVNFLTLHRLRMDHYSAESKLFDTAALMMAGYFTWDLVICIRQYKQFGLSFLLHAILSLSALYSQLSAHELRTTWLAAALLATEISTPFLHWRWFLLQGQRYGKYFQTVNILFILAFVGYRLILVEWIAVLPYTKFVLFAGPREQPLPLRLYFQLVISWLWVALNYHWAVLLGRTQLKQIRRACVKSD